jgi:hypothetical protein
MLNNSSSLCRTEKPLHWKPQDHCNSDAKFIPEERILYIMDQQNIVHRLNPCCALFLYALPDKSFSAFLKDCKKMKKMYTADCM